MQVNIRFCQRMRLDARTATAIDRTFDPHRDAAGFSQCQIFCANAELRIGTRHFNAGTTHLSTASQHQRLTMSRLRKRHDLRRQNHPMRDEGRDHFAGRFFVKLARRIELLKLAVIENCNPVSKRHGLSLVMGNVDNRRTGALVESRKFVFHRSTQMHVEIGKRFVKQDQRRGCYQTAGQSHTLPLTTRKIGRAAITKTVKIDQRQRLANTVLTLGFGNLCHPQTIADILGDRHMRPERIILEDDTDLPLFRWHVTIHM